MVSRYWHHHQYQQQYRHYCIVIIVEFDQEWSNESFEFELEYINIINVNIINIISET